jgi:ATP-dependent Clp protease ATP-binding subunit ClpB
LNRIDEVVIYNHLGEKEMRQILETYVQGLNRLLEPKNLKIEFDEASLRKLFELGYDPDFGARPLRRVFQKEIQNPLALQMIQGKFEPGTKIRVSLDATKGFHFKGE